MNCYEEKSISYDEDEELSIRFADEDKYHSVSLIKYDMEKDLALLLQI